MYNAIDCFFETATIVVVLVTYACAAFGKRLKLSAVFPRERVGRVIMIILLLTIFKVFYQYCAKRKNVSPCDPEYQISYM